MIVSGGENLFPGEVEELLITHPAIEEAAVIGVDDAEFGKRLAAFVVLAPGESVTSEDEVREFVKDNLARYKVPRDVRFLDELPRNPTGKILKRELRDPTRPPRRLRGRGSTPEYPNPFCQTNFKLLAYLDPVSTRKVGTP